MEKLFSTYDLPFHALKEIGTLAAKQFRDVNQEASTSSYNCQSHQNDEENFDKLFVCKGNHSKMKI